VHAVAHHERLSLLVYTGPTNERVSLSAKVAVEYPDNLW
jgi:hypothetical protein